MNADLTTGGSSFCYVHLTPLTNGTASLSMVHQGNSPVVYDVSIEVIDLSEQHMFPTPNQSDNFTGSRYRFKVGNVVKDWMNQVSSIPLVSEGNLSYLVLIATRNGLFSEEIKGTLLKNGKWKLNTRVYKLNEANQEYTLVHKEEYSNSHNPAMKSMTVPATAFPTMPNK